MALGADQRGFRGHRPNGHQYLRWLSQIAISEGKSNNMNASVLKACKKIVGQYVINKLRSVFNAETAEFFLESKG